jgi:hypothetical protein
MGNDTPRYSQSSANRKATEVLSFIGENKEEDQSAPSSAEVIAMQQKIALLEKQ